MRDNYNVGSIENSQAVAIGPGATAIYQQGLTIEEVTMLMKELRSAEQPTVWDGRVPYLGLNSFQESDAQFFFGREKLVADLLTKMEAASFITLAGPSGSGKSSLARAGLFHALRQERLSRSNTWPLAAMSPKSDPLTELALAVERLTQKPGSADHIRTQGLVNPHALHEQIQTLLSDDPGQRFVLLVDQFEEIFTQTRDEEVRQAFISLLTMAAREEGGRTTVILALRTEFVTQCARYPDLRELVSRHFQLVGVMEPEELARAITLPALEVGAKIDPALVSRIMADMKGEPGALPLMSFALRDLFLVETPQPGQSMDMTLAEYMNRGGLERALERHADRVFSAFSETERQVARYIFSGVIEVGEDVRVDTRRTAQFSELIPPGQTEETVRQVVDVLAGKDARLLTTDQARGETGGQTTVTLAHEKLLDVWPWLRQLVSENREAIRLRNQIAADARRWAENEDAGYLYRGGRLAGVEEQLAKLELNLSGEANSFIQSSLAERDRVLAREIEQQRDKATAERNRQRSWFLAVGLVTALTATLLVVWFWQQAQVARSLAEDQVRRQNLTVESRFALGRDQPDESLLKALAAVYPANEAENLIALTMFDLRQILDQDNLLLAQQLSHSLSLVAWSPDGSLLYVGSEDGTGWVWSLDGEPSPFKSVEIDAEDIKDVAWSSGSDRILFGHATGVTVWDIETDSLLDLDASPGAGLLVAVGWSPNGNLVAGGGTGGILELWNATTGQPLHEFAANTTSISALTWLSDSQIAVGRTTGSIEIWDLEEQRMTQEAQASQGNIWELAWHARTEQLLVIGADAEVWMAEPLTRIGHLDSSGIIAHRGSWYPDGNQVLLLDMYDARIMTWNAGISTTTATQMSDGNITVRAHAPKLDWGRGTLSELRSGYGWGKVMSAEISPSGQMFATVGWDGTFALWNIGSETFRDFPGHFSVAARVQWHPDGQHFLTVDEMGTVRIWDLLSSAVQFKAEPFGYSNPYSTVRWNPTGNWLLAPITVFMCWDSGIYGACLDQAQHLKFKDPSDIPYECGVETSMNCLAIWDWVEDKLVAAIPLEDDVWQIAWSPDSQTILVGVALYTNTDQTTDESPSRLFRWDLTSNTITTLGESKSGFRALDYAPGGASALVAYGDGTLLVGGSRSDSWTPFEHPLGDKISAATWLDDEQILLGGSDGSVWLWNGRVWRKIVEGREHLGVEVTSIAKRPDGPEILTTSRDGTTRVWRTDSWVLSDLLNNPDRESNGFQNEVFSGSWSPTGGHILNATFDKMARLWIGRDAVAARLTERVCLTMDEDKIQAEITDWRGCEVELAAVNDNLAEYRRLMGTQ